MSKKMPPGTRVRVVGYPDWVGLDDLNMLPVGSEWVVDQSGYISEKRWSTHPGAGHHLEVIEDETSPAPMQNEEPSGFKVGQRVRFTKGNGGYYDIADWGVVLRSVDDDAAYDVACKGIDGHADYPKGLYFFESEIAGVIEDEIISTAPMQTEEPDLSEVDVGTYAVPLPPDNVFQPAHYARFTIEPITFINANGLPYNIGNVIKYSCRYDAKNGVEDLRKARRYLDIQIETLERQERIKAGEEAREVWKVAL